MSVFFSKMIGTLAVIMVVAAFIGGSDLLNKLLGNDKNGNISFWQDSWEQPSAFTETFPVSRSITLLKSSSASFIMSFVLKSFVL